MKGMLIYFSNSNISSEDEDKWRGLRRRRRGALILDDDSDELITDSESDKNLNLCISNDSLTEFANHDAELPSAHNNLGFGPVDQDEDEESSSEKSNKLHRDSGASPSLTNFYKVSL